MLRVSLAAYILLLSLTGPNPCCCTLARFVSNSTTWARARSHGNTQLSGCCCHKPGFDLRSGPRTPISNDRGKRCPCAKNLCHAIVPQPVELTDDMVRLGLDELPDEVRSHFFVAGNMLADVSRPDDIPPLLLSGRDLRIAICSWCC